MDVRTVLAERDAARAERDAARRLLEAADAARVAAIAERDAVRQALDGPFSSAISHDPLHFASWQEPPTSRDGEPIFHPPEFLFPPHFFRPLRWRIASGLAAVPRLNLLLPSTSAAHNSGGPNTAYLLAAALARAGVPIRFIAVNKADASSDAIRAHVARLASLPARIARSLSFVDANGPDTVVEVGEHDVFAATAWWTAQMLKYVLPRVRTSRFLYLVQDYEPNLHPISTNALLALETYGMDCLPIVNSRLLYDHFVTEGIGRFRDADFAREACWFEPSVDRALFHPAPAAPPAGRKRRLLFYARPDVPRNLLELGLAALMRVIEMGALRAHEWEFRATATGTGGACRPIHLTASGSAVLEPLELFDLPTWAGAMRETDIVLSLIWSPHTSYPVLEGAASAALVVTNTCGVKSAERLRALSRNIIAGTPTIEGIASAICGALARVPDRAARLADADMNLPATWADSFAPALPRLLGFLEQAGLFSQRPGRRTS